MNVRRTLFCLLALAGSILPIWASDSLEMVDGDVGFAAGDNLGDHRATQNLDLAGFALHGAGDITASGTVTAGSFEQASDATLKTNIKTIDDPFSLLDGVAGSRFDWIDTGDAAYGVLAQDLERVMPEAVGRRTDGKRTVDYSQLIAPLVEAAKQNRDAIEDLRRQNQQLQRQLDGVTPWIELDPASAITYQDRASCHRIENLNATLTVRFPIFTADAWQNSRELALYEVGGASVRVTPCDLGI